MTIGQAEAAIFSLVTYAGMTRQEAEEMVWYYIQNSCKKRVDIAAK